MNESIKALREALQFSPENVPLRLHLADQLLGASLAQEACEEYKAVLGLKPAHAAAKLGLARCYYMLRNYSAGILAAESLYDEGAVTPELNLLMAKLLVAEGEVPKAVAYYQQAVADNPALKDEELELQLKASRTAMNTATENENETQEAQAAPSWNVSKEDQRWLQKPETSFKDVGGMEQAKEEINHRIIQPFLNPDLYKAYGMKSGGGILMYGPPGCGKTFLARATAGEVNAGFLPVGLHEILDMWMGNSEKNLREVFQVARRNTPAVLFFDEVDALAADRSDFRQASGRFVINQFLAELDGVEQNNEGVLILAATNAPWHLDPAFRRPGRFDSLVFIPPPDEAGRESILQLQLAGKPCEPIQFSALIPRTEGFSGADLKSLVDVAVQGKLREAAKTGKISPLRTQDLVNALATVRPSTRQWFTSAKNYVTYGNNAGQYDDILAYMKKQRLL